MAPDDMHCPASRDSVGVHVKLQLQDMVVPNLVCIRCAGLLGRKGSDERG